MQQIEFPHLRYGYDAFRGVIIFGLYYNLELDVSSPVHRLVVERVREELEECVYWNVRTFEAGGRIGRYDTSG